MYNLNVSYVVSPDVAKECLDIANNAVLWIDKFYNHLDKPVWYHRHVKSVNHSLGENFQVVRGAAEWFDKFHGNDNKPVWLQHAKTVLTNLDQNCKTLYS